MQESKREVLERGSMVSLLLRYALPSVVVMLFFGLQSLIDGLVVGNYIGAEALGGVNIILPLFSVVMVVSLTVGIGCQTVVSQGFGSGDTDRSQRAMTTGFWTLTLLSLAGSVILWFWAEKFVKLLGADEILLPYAMEYFRGFVPFMLPMSLCFYSDLMLKAMGRPIASTVIMALVVLLNIGFSLWFVLGLKMGTLGASMATGFAFTIGLFISGSITFNPRQKVSMLKGRFSKKILLRAMYNGSSEGVLELSSAISMLIINNVMIRLEGADGVSAFTAINYINFIGILIFLGVSDGLIPVMSYNYGAGRYERLLNIVRFVARGNLIVGIIIFLFLQFYGHLAIDLFFNSNHSHVLSIAQNGLRIFSFVFLVNGINILITSFFTSIGNALGSIIIALLRGVVFLAVGMLILPSIFGVNGVWTTIVVSELLTLCVAVILLYSVLRRLRNLRSQYSH